MGSHVAGTTVGALQRCTFRNAYRCRQQDAADYHAMATACMA